MLKEFKEFAMRGNVIDMAVGIVIGAAFGKIVSSLVADIIMPPIGLLLGRVDFSNLFADDEIRSGEKGHTSAVIAAVFKFAQTFQQEGASLTFSYVTYDAAHFVKSQNPNSRLQKNPKSQTLNSKAPFAKGSNSR